jgi:cytokinin riboside 5'-monophosphate phosphoribohydrolase
MRVCVFCSSSDAVEARLLEQGRALGAALAGAGHEVVYGGTSVGTMGAVAAGARGVGGRVVGILPAFLRRRDIADEACDELVVTDTLLERKQQMLARSDAFVALPGGLGTLDELLEVVTHIQLGQLTGPVVLLDAQGFWDRFWRVLEDLEHRGMARAPDEVVQRCNDLDGLLDALARGPERPAAVRRA